MDLTNQPLKMTSTKQLFEAVVPETRLHQSFVSLRDAPGSVCCRMMLEDVFADFVDYDGNFLEQFQTSGFDSRFFELYLFAYFSRSGFSVNQEFESPDFLLTKDGLSVAVEATTVNHPDAGVLKEKGRTIAELDQEELMHYLMQELPMRFGSPLFSKLKRRYWEKRPCNGLPLVFAIEAFHDADAHMVSDGALMTYLYGSKSSASWDERFRLQVTNSRIDSHSLGSKTIPSGFFSQPDSEYVSAVLFTNSGTSGKFSRMGLQHGFGADSVMIARQGQCYTPLEDARDPSVFYYNLECPPLVESWGQGLVVMHNPNCLRPIPRSYFPNAVQAFIKNGSIVVDFDETNPWHPYVSKTIIVPVGSEVKEMVKTFPPGHAVAVMAIDKAHFDHFVPGKCLVDDAEEQGWYSDDTSSFFGTVIHFARESSWSGYIFARNKQFQFKPIQQKDDFKSREEARYFVQMQISGLLVHSPQRIFDPSISGSTSAVN